MSSQAQIQEVMHNSECTSGTPRWEWGSFTHTIAPWLLCGFLAFAPFLFLFFDAVVRTQIQAESWLVFFKICGQLFCTVLRDNNVLGVGLSLSSAFVCSTLYMGGGFVRIMLVVNVVICVIYAFCLAHPFKSESFLIYFNLLGLGSIVFTNLIGFIAVAGRQSDA